MIIAYWFRLTQISSNVHAFAQITNVKVCPNNYLRTLWMMLVNYCIEVMNRIGLHVATRSDFSFYIKLRNRVSTNMVPMKVDLGKQKQPFISAVSRFHNIMFFFRHVLQLEMAMTRLMVTHLNLLSVQIKREQIGKHGEKVKSLFM